MTRARWLLASLLPLALTRCALSDDFALEPAADSKADPAPPTSKGGSLSDPGPTDKGRGGNTSLPAAGGVGGASGGSGGISGPEPVKPGEMGVAGDAGMAPAAGQGGTPNDCSVKTYDGHLYALCLFPDESQWVTYDEARSRCAELGAQLDSSSDFALTAIESKPENDFLKDWIKKITPLSKEVMVWSGANDIEQERTWVWGQGASAVRFFDQARDGGGKAVGSAFEDFPPDKPNSANDWDEDCGGFDSELAWQWNDFKCEDPRLGYVCEEVP